MSAIIKIIAKNPPSILIALGGLLLIMGYSINNFEMGYGGWFLIGLGVVLQVLWLFKK